MIKILSVWLKEKNSIYGSKSRSLWTHVLSPSWPRLGACKQVKNSLCISRYCDRACRRLSDGQSGVQGVIRRIVMWELSLWRSVSWRNEDCVSIHAYLQDIIIMNLEEKIQGWSRQSTKIGFNLINSQSIYGVPSRIKWSYGMVSNCQLCFVN